MEKDEKEHSEDPAPPMTTQDFTNAINKLTDRARSAGVNTAKVMVAAGAVELMKVLDGLLEGLDGSKKPKGKKKTPRA